VIFIVKLVVQSAPPFDRLEIAFAVCFDVTEVVDVEFLVSNLIL
jgi:hypothetical protein